MEKLHDAGGSARQIKIQGDTNSALMRELIAQLNQSALPQVVDVGTVGDGTTVRKLLGTWKKNAWIRRVGFISENADTLDEATTKLAVSKQAAGSFDLSSAGTELFSATDFDVQDMPAKETIYSDDFSEGVNCGTIAGRQKGWIIKAGEFLLVEITNNEGGDRDFHVVVEMVMTDRIDIQPDSLQHVLPHRVQTQARQRGDI